MTRYFSTFISGFRELIQDELKSVLTDVELEAIFDGLVIYKTNQNPQKINFFNNTFRLISQEKNVDKNLINPFIKGIVNNLNEKEIRDILPVKKANFRLVVSRENEFLKIHNEILKKLELKISLVTKWDIERSNPEYEFWFVIRNEGIGLFGLRITKNNLKPNKGELREELVDLLILLSEPKNDDIFLDPFAGSGIITKLRNKKSFKKIIASDLNPQNEKIERIDATNLFQIKENSIDKIVTDPPWGDFVKVENNFYDKMFGAFKRVLKKNGILILLLGRNIAIEDYLKKHEFIIAKRYDVLVNGKKASVYKILAN